MTALTPAVVPDVGDVGSSGLRVHSPRASVPGSPEILVPASDRELASPALSSSPYDFSKTIVENVKENGEKTQGTGENPF